MLAPGFTRFRGVILNKLEANELRRLTKRLRRELQNRNLVKAKHTFDEMCRSAHDASLRKAIDQLYDEEVAIALPQENPFHKAVCNLLKQPEVSSGWFGSSIADPDWLIGLGFPRQLVDGWIEEFHYDPERPHNTLITRYTPEGAPYHVDQLRGVAGLRVLWALADILEADTKEAEQCFGRKECARRLAASIEKAIKER